MSRVRLQRRETSKNRRYATGFSENRPLKIKKIIAESAQTAGLRLINSVARSGGYKVCRDISYGSHERNKLDYYVRHCDLDEDISSRPLVLFIYGGNWQSGNRRDYRFVADTLCSMGCDVVIPDYRLYPEVRFRDMLEDVRSAATWIFENKNIHANRPVYIMGHSAGAQLGSLLCLNGALLSHIEGVESRIAAFIGLSGPYDFYPYTEESHWDLFAPEHEYPLSRLLILFGRRRRSFICCMVPMISG